MIDDYKLEAAAAERSGDYGKVAEIRYGKIQEAENEIKTLQAEIEKNHAAGAMIKEEIDAEDIAEVVARWTGIPVSPGCCKANARNCCRWKAYCTSG